MNIEKHILKKYNIKTDVIEIPDVTRVDLAELFHDLDLRLGVEIGVAAGAYSSVLMETNPQLTLYGVDPWTSYKGYKDYTREATFNRLMTEAHERLDRYPNYKFIRKTSMEALDDFEDSSLDFVYIDANHSEPFVSQDIREWTKKVKPGGIVSGDDYARLKGRDGQDSDNWAVIPALHKYTKENNLQLFIWGLEAKLPGLKRDSSRSWMFVKSDVLKNRIDLAKYFANQDFRVGAEVGVYKGEYSQILLENNPGLKLLLVDSWEAGRRVPAKEEAIARTANYNVKVIHASSVEAADRVEDGSLDFVFIDAGHSYEDVKADLAAWVPKVRRGGIVSGHDYYEFPSGKGGVIPAVNEYVAYNGYDLQIIPWDKSQSTDNRQPCWYFWKNV